MKQTAVEWLENKCREVEARYYSLPSKLYDYIQQVKEIEKQQIEDAYQQGFNNAYFSNPLSKEQYYNETFKK